jgi:hypothetical protein
LAAFPLLVVIDRGLHCTEARPAVRTLETTLRHSLFCPQLSNRSYAGPFYSVLLSGGLLWLAYLRKPRPNEPAAQQGAAADLATASFN